MILTKAGFKKKRGNSIHDVKLRLWITFSVIALSTSFLVFLAFGLRLVLFEEAQIEKLLGSFEQVAVKHYQLEQEPFANLSEHVSAYYGESNFDDTLKSLQPFKVDGFTKNYTFLDFKPNSNRGPSGNGLVVYHFNFDYKGETIPTYLAISAFAIDFGDDNWDALLGISTLLMIFLLVVLRISLKRVFDGLMSPISELTEQLVSEKDTEFKTSPHSIEELQQLTTHLNRYKQMKERVAKQELMFAKYASHELKTPIAIVLGAANLQAMSDEPNFQTKQRDRILKAGQGMQETVEVLLNIVKQENVNQHSQHAVSSSQLQLDKYRSKLNQGVELHVDIEQNAELNLPVSVLNMVLKNLVENAIRFTESGEIRVKISGTAIQVIDSGSGLTETPETEHGLGLLIVQRICQSYGWRFQLLNNPQGKGCAATMERI